jgi:hypothetical protein
VLIAIKDSLNDLGVPMLQDLDDLSLANTKKGDPHALLDHAPGADLDTELARLALTLELDLAAHVAGSPFLVGVSHPEGKRKEQ